MFFCDKLSKRRDQDISTVAAGYRLRIKDGKIEDVRIGFGGMAATPKRASHVEQALEGRAFSAAPSRTPPLPSPRTSSRSTTGAARRPIGCTVAANLLRRLYWRIAEPQRAVEVEAL